MNALIAILVVVVVVVGLGLLWFVRSSRVREIMSLANVPTASRAEQDVIAKEHAAERAEFELAIAVELFETPNTLNALAATAGRAHAEAFIARGRNCHWPSKSSVQGRLRQLSMTGSSLRRNRLN